MNEKESYLNFLDESFPGLKNNILRCESLGFPWSSRPFIKKEKGKLLSHVGFIDYPLLIDGKLRKAGALHAVCTTASYRGQGLASELIQETLVWAKESYEFILLFTELPKFYEKLQFRHIQEYRFHLCYNHSKKQHSLRQVFSPDDNVLFQQLCLERTPLSNHVWMKDTGYIAPYNTLFATYPIYWSLYYSSSFNGLLSFQLNDKTLHLFDVIARKMPSLDLILSHFSNEINEIYFYFSPDLFTSEAKPEPFLYDHGYMLVHGNWTNVRPFMISPISRC
jgi:GNAT superfamily N-acetyltransferase